MDIRNVERKLRGRTLSANISVLLRKMGVLSRFNYDADISLGGTKIKVPMGSSHAVADDLLFLRAGFKTSLLKMLKDVATTDVFVDIGANCGQTLIEVYAWNPGIHYFGFEPNVAAFSLLQRIASANRIHSTLFPWACSSRSEPIRLFTLGAVDTSGTVHPEIRSFYRETDARWIASYSFDTIAPHLRLPKNFVMKIDVEGAELDVVRGSTHALQTLRPPIICEVLHAHSAEHVESNNAHKYEIEVLLSELNYRIFSCKLSSGELTGLERVQALPKNVIYADSPDTCDFLFLPSEMSEDKVGG